MQRKIRLSLSMLRREWRAGELRTLFYAAAVGVMCVTTVGFFVDRIQQALILQSSELMAADLRVSSDSPISPQYFDLAKRLELRTTEFQTFRSMLMVGDRPKLVEVKAINDGYPLRGKLQLSNQNSRFYSQTAPSDKTIWIDDRLRQQMALQSGDNLHLGNNQFIFTNVIFSEPDRAGDMFSIAPRVMIATDDLFETGLIQEGSRIRYFLLLAGSVSAIKQYKDELTEYIKPGERIESVTDARNEIRTAMQRAEQFFGLVAVVSLLLSLTAIGICARRYAGRNTRVCALMRCLGSKQKEINQLFFIQLFLLGSAAGIVGAVLGWLSHHVLALLIGQLLLVSLPSSSLLPMLPGLVVGILGVVLVGMPSILNLKNVPTLTVLRDSNVQISLHSGLSYLFGLLLVSAMIFWLSASTKMATILIASLVMTIFVLAVAAYSLLRLLKFIPVNRMNAWALGVRALTRNPLRNVTQVLAFGVAVMAILLLTMIRGDILALWQDKLPDDIPNRFVVNVQPNQLSDVQTFLRKQNLADVEFYPIVRARLSAINNQKISADDSGGNDAGQREHSLQHREYKMSWRSNIQKDNEVVKGEWWSSDLVSDKNETTHLFSVEDGMAKSLGVKLGDKLTFTISDSELTATVANLRSVQWDSFHPNFYVLAPPGLLDNFPVSYITSLYVSDLNVPVIDKLVAAFPNLTVIDVSEIIQRIRTITNRVSMAIEYMFLLTLLTGAVLLLATIRVSYDQRRQEAAVLRALGASRQQIFNTVKVEFAILGALSGLLAAIFASVTAHVLADQLFQQSYYPSLWYWLIAIVFSTVGTAIIGSRSLRSIVKVSPLQSLANTSN